MSFLVGLLFLIGFGILAYPTISNQWNTYRQSRLLTTYDETVTQLAEAGVFSLSHHAVPCQVQTGQVLPVPALRRLC